MLDFRCEILDGRRKTITSLRGTKQFLQYVISSTVEKSIIIILFLLISSITSQAKILLPQILSSNMVIQQNQPIKVWGYGKAGEKVAVKFAGFGTSTTTDANGNWSVQLKAQKASSKPQSMTIVGENTIVLDNILIGEVWLCSGQSNMEYQMRKLVKIPTPLKPELGFPKDEVENAKNDQIRIFLVNRKQLSKPDSVHKSWNIASGDPLRAFSAVGYFFAKELQAKLGVPVGVISSAVSGSAIEPWIASFAQEDFFKDKKVSNDPGKFYAPMIEPLTSFAIKGVLWYQGETNCFLNEDISYAYKLKTLIKNWRKAWKTDFPFYYVQIAPYDYSKQKSDKTSLTVNTEPNFWEAQQQTLRMANTGMIATPDLNDNGGDLHPTYKWEVGRRLALLALGKTYQQSLDYSGPIYKSYKVKGNSIVLDFDFAKGMKSKKDELKGFEIAGEDGVYKPASASLQGNQILVSSTEVSNPKNVRYDWSESPSGSLTSSTGLPALPFRTNNHLTKQFNPN